MFIFHELNQLLFPQMLDKQPVPAGPVSQLHHDRGLPIPGGGVQSLHGLHGGI